MYITTVVMAKVNMIHNC